MPDASSISKPPRACPPWSLPRLGFDCKETQEKIGLSWKENWRRKAVVNEVWRDHAQAIEVPEHPFNDLLFI